MSIEIPVFADEQVAKATPSKAPAQPAPIFNPRLPHTWALTPKGMFGDETCAYLIALLTKGGSNAIVLNEKGVLEFAVVERSA